jgi:LuxR family transcriptional regulator, maltose regulon positive regulatory protein
MAILRSLSFPAFALEALCLFAYETAAIGDIATARTLFEEALALSQEAGDTAEIARALCGLGYLALRSDNLAEATLHFEKSIKTMQQMKQLATRFTDIPASSLEGLAIIANAQNQAIRATRLLGAADALRRKWSQENPLEKKVPFWEDMREATSLTLLQYPQRMITYEKEEKPARLRSPSTSLILANGSRFLNRALGERAASSATQRSLLDYFVTEILETQPEPLQRFLLQTSVLPRLSGNLCNAVIGNENSALQLEAIERAGLFLEALEGPGEWYRYHALFAEAMRREAAGRLGEETLRALSLRASSWYEREELFTEAIEAAWLAPDAERVARLIEQVNERGFHEPQTMLPMLRWLEQFPETVLREHPLLCHFLAVELRFPVAFRFSQTAIPTASIPLISETVRARIETLLQMAEEGWRRQEMQPWIGTNWAFRLLSGLLDQEPFPTLVNYARQAFVFLPKAEILDSRLQMYRSVCLLFLGIEKLRLGQIGEALPLLLQAQEDNMQPGNIHLAIDIRLMLGKVHLIQGELRQAEGHFRQLYADARELDNHEIIADALLELAWLAFERNDLAGAEQQVREALEEARRLYPQQSELSARAELQFALLQHVRGETTAALEQLTTMLASPQKEWTPASLWLYSRLRSWQGRLRIATGDFQALQDTLEIASQSDTGSSVTDRLGAQILQGRVLLAQGEAGTALPQFVHLLLLAREHLHQYAALEIQLLLARAHAACKQEQQAHYWLRQTLARAVHEGSIRLFLNEGQPLIHLLRALLPTLQDKALRSYAQMILRAEAQGYGPQAASDISPDGVLPEPLSPQEQRVLRLLVAGWSNADIARELVISVNTVKYHVKHLYQKLGVSNRLQASEAARELKPG